MNGAREAVSPRPESAVPRDGAPGSSGPSAASTQAGLAHDISTLLGVIANCATVLSRHVTDSADSAAVNDILAAVDAASGLTRQLSRDRTGSRQLVDLADVVRESAPTLHHVLGERVVLDLDLPQRRALVTGDRGEFERLLLNLAANSRDAMPDGGVFGVAVRCAADVPAGEVVLTVTDTGTGMTPAAARHAFEPYVTSKGADGTGLGLAIVRDVARRSGGDALLDSAPGQGTRVVVRLGSSPAGRR